MTFAKTLPPGCRLMHTVRGSCDCHPHDGYLHPGLYPYPTLEEFALMPLIDRQVAGLHVRFMIKRFRWELSRPEPFNRYPT